MIKPVVVPNGKCIQLRADLPTEEIQEETDMTNILPSRRKFPAKMIDTKKNAVQRSFIDENVLETLRQCNDVPRKLIDEFSLMQCSQYEQRLSNKNFKTSPFSDEQDDLLQAFREGHAQPQPEQNSADEADSTQSSDGYGPIAAHEQEPHPPSDEEGRQDVYLFHLADPPIRAMLIWTDYDLMIQEISRHFQLQQGMVVDAYEVAVPLPDLPDSAAAAVVHLLPDLPMGRQLCLPIFDIETHGHRIERHFKTGLAVERFVLPTPRRISRNGLLVLVNLDQYCEFERGRCIVYLNQVRWPDTDQGFRDISSGDYFRIAVPPSEHYDCETSVMVQCLQAGLSHDEILSHVQLEGVQEGFSPEMLDDDEIRMLRTPNLVHGDDLNEDDSMQALQLTTCTVQNKAPNEGLDLPHDGQDDECTGFQFRSSAREFRPGNQEHHEMDETTQILHTQWQDRAFA
eukprot:s3226_g10.t1